MAATDAAVELVGGLRNAASYLRRSQPSAVAPTRSIGPGVGVPNSTSRTEMDPGTRGR